LQPKSTESVRGNEPFHARGSLGGGPGKQALDESQGSLAGLLGVPAMSAKAEQRLADILDRYAARWEALRALEALGAPKGRAVS
jgi:hypothetical protein